MQIVIDIKPQIIDALNNENEWTALLLAELQDIINNGKPFPKGHGRLIDADALMKDYGNPDIEILLDNMDTIIGADMAESEDEE